MPLTTDTVRSLVARREPPCVSVFLPTARSYPDSQQNSIRFKNLLQDVDRTLREKYSGSEVNNLLAELRPLEDDEMFWAHQLDGLAVFAALGFVESHRLPRPVPERAVVAGSFHVKPVLRVAQSAARFHVLALDREKAELYEASRDSIDQIPLPADFPGDIERALGKSLIRPRNTRLGDDRPPEYQYEGGRPRQESLGPGHGGKTAANEADTQHFFQTLDGELPARYSRPSGLPLVLVATPEHQSLFRRVTENKQLLPTGIERHPNGFSSPAELREAAWEVVRPGYEQRLASLRDTFELARSRGIAGEAVSDVAKAVVAARVGTLLVDADKTIPGRYDPTTGEVTAGRTGHADTDDLLDDLAEGVLRTGGEVVVVPTAAMPTQTGLAATFRF